MNASLSNEALIMRVYNALCPDLPVQLLVHYFTYDKKTLVGTLVGA